MRKMKVIGLALGLVAIVAIAQPAQAACGAPFLISNTNGNTGVYNGLVNPTVTLGVDGLNGTSVTENITGYFWGVGVGDPATGVGADNGGWLAVSWLYLYPGYNTGILTSWAEDPSIDGCIDVQAAQGSRCQVTYFQDTAIGTGEGLFALVSTPDDAASGDFYLDLGGVDIVMAPSPAMPILSSTRGGDTSVTVGLAGPTAEAIAAGSFLDPAAACQGGVAGGQDPLNGLVQGFRVCSQVLPRGSEPPSDFNIANWDCDPATDSPLGAPVEAAAACAEDSDVYFSWALVMDSGFLSLLVSNNATRVECGANLADSEPRIRIAPETRQAPTQRERQR